MQGLLNEIVIDLRKIRQTLMDAEEASNVKSTARTNAIAYLSLSIAHIESSIKQLELFGKV